jgi:hypothetical protein
MGYRLQEVSGLGTLGWTGDKKTCYKMRSDS